MRLQETSILFDRSSYRYNYLCHYLPIAAGMDTLSRSLMKFKRCAPPDLDAWIDYAREALAENPPARDSILLRALGHRELIASDTCSPLAGLHRELIAPDTCSPLEVLRRETNAQNTRPSPLDHLCRTLALDFGCRYLPTLLSKSQETPGNKNLSRAQREARLLDVYSADISGISPSTPLIIIDDILTTGATIRAIIAALRRKSATCPIRIFTLGRASNDPLQHNNTPLHGANYHFDPRSGWIRADTRRSPDPPPLPANAS